MKKVLVTGGSGLLGTEVVKELHYHNFEPIVLSFQKSQNAHPNVDTLFADLTDKESLLDLPNEFDVIIHCASNPLNSFKVDVEGTINLLKYFNKSTPPHIIYISIVGVDSSEWPYYQNKYKVENIIQNSGYPWTICRITQFHDFVLKHIIQPLENNIDSIFRIPKGLVFQSIDKRDAAMSIVDSIKGETKNSILIFGGPEIQDLKSLVKEYFSIKTRRPVSIEEFDSDNEFYRIFTTGINLCPEYRIGTRKWNQFIQDNFYKT